MATSDTTTTERPLKGYTGNLLRVDLEKGAIIIEKMDEDIQRRYLGGSGFNTYFLWKELKAGIDPLGPENKLIIATGPVTGTPIMGSGRHSIGAKSPLTGGIALSQVGEFWRTELKRAGFDMVIIEGKAIKPVYLSIRDGRAELRDATHLWGQDTRETQTAIKLRDTIGAGMDGCFACPMRCKKKAKFDEPYPHDPAYGGPEYETLGALGSNLGIDNLKAIVKGNELCNAGSIDTISAGGVIAFCMEAYERGMLSKEQADGIEMTWGNADAMLACIRKIIRREGFTGEDDRLPQRYLEPKTSGVLSERCLDPDEMERAKRYYYALMGWDIEGVPLPERVEELYIE